MRRSGSIDVDGGCLAYTCVGRGEPVVLVHGFTLDQRVWRPQVRSLRRRFRVLTYDCRGFGRSTCPTGPYNHADDLAVVIAALGGGPVHLVGMSMGGRIVLGFALRRPHAVRSLTLIGADVGGYRHDIDWDVPADQDDLTAARSAWLGHELFATARRDPVVWCRVRSMVADYSGWHWLHEDVRVPPDTDTWDRLAEITVPATAVVGEHDLPDFHQVARSIELRMPRASRVVVAGAGHLVNLESPSICTALITARAGALN
ncbi:alpha/beta fold hydrolase [Solwaraspora sp. WMMA2065]|uniref:alpha/beta fold hydrolase n=1 Tax=Solwaraspora sp. WMMA2065 TaxID=3015166 RepID=UPI00259B5D57|nr:alpha/beta fold hydrolase [Solwaraspora sp. WMMA2065]WJK33068.1 alpha/beta fold hydrolase [Solwaraspora sp. WMMA2065]